MLNTLKKTRSATMRGLTLIEALLFLGIAAIVIVSAVAFYNNASNSSKMNQAQTQIQAYISGVKSLYASRDSYATVNNALIITAGKAPENAIRGTTGLRNPWGGGTTIAGANNYFEISMDTLADDVCTSILSTNMLDNGSIFRIAANSTAFTNGNSPDPAQAAAACTSATNNTITFRVR